MLLRMDFILAIKDVGGFDGLYICLNKADSAILME